MAGKPTDLYLKHWKAKRQERLALDLKDPFQIAYFNISQILH